MRYFLDILKLEPILFKGEGKKKDFQGGFNTIIVIRVTTREKFPFPFGSAKTPEQTVGHEIIRSHRQRLGLGTIIMHPHHDPHDPQAGLGGGPPNQAGPQSNSSSSSSSGTARYIVKS